MSNITQEQINELQAVADTIQPKVSIPDGLSEIDAAVYDKYTKIYEQLSKDGDSFALTFILPDSGDGKVFYRLGELSGPEDELLYGYRSSVVYETMSDFVRFFFTSARSTYKKEIESTEKSE